MRKDGLHGGYFHHKIRQPVSGEIFLVGDSAGMCFPATGEGIRQVIFFGGLCGRILKRALNKQISIEQARKLYIDEVKERSKYYGMLYNFQRMLIRAPNFVVESTARFGKKHFDWFWRQYLNTTDYYEQSKLS